ncbi:MAG: KH domain-containing protein, partial [Ruminiclostridium sp.]
TNKGEDIVDIGVVIICERQSHKGMIIGKGGSMLKKIGQVARAEMEEYFEQKVNMKLWVKVKDDWRNSDVLITDFGLNAE